MMDQIMMALVLISIFSIVNGQLFCYVCTDCPNVDDAMVPQPCDFISPPDTTTTTLPPDTTTLPPDTTTLPPDTTTLPPDTTTLPPDTTTLPPDITTLPPETLPSTPQTPPTASTTVSPPTISNLSAKNDILINESIIEMTTDKSTDPSDENSDKTIEGSTQISLGPPYRKLLHRTNGSHQCFRIGRTVGDRTEVVRGCVAPADTIHQTCVRANNGTAPISCRICQFNECNSTTRNMSTSVVLLFTSIVSITFMR